MRVKTVLEQGGGDFISIDPDKAVDQALKLMSGHGVSALVVAAQGRYQGIFTERDLLRCHILFPHKELAAVLVRDAMSFAPVISCADDFLENALGTMNQAKVRHLPVVIEGQVKGMLCLEDLVLRHLGVLTRELDYLKSYIKDLQDAAHD